MNTSDIILIILAHSAIFGALCYFIGQQREIGPIAGAFLGVALGTIGLIIVLCTARKPPVNFADQLQKYRSMFENGLISEVEYSHLKGRLFEQRYI